MTEVEAAPTDQDLAEQLRPLVNDILDRFNQEHISPAGAGMVILALIHRLMEVLEDVPEARRYFILTLMNLVNSFLTEENKVETGREE